jgi:hypothetical protein
MPPESSRPVLNPVLRFTKEPRPESVTGGGKSADSIRTDRLERQRERLAREFRTMAAVAEDQPKFNGRAVLYASMFDDSLAPSWTPKDLFSAERGAQLMTPFRSGYLVEVDAERLARFARVAESAQRVFDKVDISRVKSVRFFDEEDAAGARNLDEAWAAAPKVPDGRIFLVWLMPLRDAAASEHLLRKITSMRDRVIASPPPLLAGSDFDLATAPTALRRNVRLLADVDRLNIAMRTYRQIHQATTTVVVPSRAALTQFIASGTVFRLEPVQPISSTAPGEGREPARPLPRDMSHMPVVGVIDGGLTAASYKAAEAWKAPCFIKDNQADVVHGNRVTSLVVQGHDWNNKLSLPALYCQVGTVQAVPKKSAGALLDPQDFLAYLDAVMDAYPETKVWNLSFNEPGPCDVDAVSYLGHGLAHIARKHCVLPVISVGNQPGALLQPPADCEAAITIGGRLHATDGSPAGACPVSLQGPGPSSMLKPELSHFSHVRVLGGLTTKGSSFSTALMSPLAAHAMERLREPSPDLVKALPLHRADGDAFDPAIGFGSPGEPFPWECPAGFVTLQWTARLKPGAAYYWELPIPPALKQTGKLRGLGKLTAILNPHPLVSDIAGPNYFSARIETALQFERGGKFHNLLGALNTDKLTEEQARRLDHKWSPVRQHAKAFRGVAFEGNDLRVYARSYVRDLFLYPYGSIDEVPEMDVVFVLTVGTGSEDDEIYHELRNALGAFVETSVVDLDAEIDQEF